MPDIPRGTARHEIARAVLTDLAALHHLIAPVPNIIGPAFGATWCDRALKVRNAVDHLMTGIETALPDAFNPDAAWKRPCPRPPTPRTTLRDRAGEPPLPDNDRRRPGPPLSAREHITLDADLCRLRDGLRTAYVALAHAYGPAHDLPRRARKASTALLKLRNKLNSQVHAISPPSADATRPHGCAALA